jgi:hypothetical protein
MNLSDAQKQQVATWLQQGAQLAEVQKRLEAEFGLRLTYMEVKFLVSDLQVLPRDREPVKPVALPPKPAAPAATPPGTTAPETEAWDAAEEAPPSGGVSVSIDQLTRPGAMVSGNVTFPDGKSAAWYIDQMGRIGVAPKDKGHRPSAADMQQFQMVLERELARAGF